MKFSKRFPIPGQRIIRSVIAVGLCFLVYLLRGSRGIPFYSAIAVLQCMQPYAGNMKKVARTRMLGTLIGAFWGVILILIEYYFMDEAVRTGPVGFLVVSIFTGIVIYSTVVMRVPETAYFSGVVFLCVTVAHGNDTDPWMFALNRIIDTLIGILVAVLVNNLHLPRRKNRDILFVSSIGNTIIGPEQKLTPYSKFELNWLIDEGMNFTVSTHETPARVRELLDGVHLKLPIIAMAGSVLYDLDKMEYISVKHISEDHARRMYDFIRGAGYPCFVTVIEDQLLVIQYDELGNKGMRELYQIRRMNPHRNYVRLAEPVFENAVYLLVVDTDERAAALYDRLMKQPWSGDYRIIMSNDDATPGYQRLRIYDANVSRATMLEELKRVTGIEKAVTFGSVPGRCDVCIEDVDHNRLVHELKRRYEPFIWS